MIYFEHELIFMPVANQYQHPLSSRSVTIWRIAQAVVWLIGAAIFVCLVFFPPTGLLLFWNILIPLAPAILVLFTGVWRNVCPLATTNLLPRHFGLSKKKKLTTKQLGVLNLIAVLALYVIVPLRHAIFNTSGMATAVLISTMVAAGMVLGFFYEWKSAWCSGLCPIHPVEKLYGGSAFLTIANAHCDQCMNCVVPCPDSTPNIHPLSSKKTIFHRLSGMLIIGGLPGFIWGWFQTADEKGIGGVYAFVRVYENPLIGFLISLAVYALCSAVIRQRFEKKLISFFAAAGVSCYYWFRVPALFGFGNQGTDGLLVDLRGAMPQVVIQVIILAVAAFFFYWMVIREPHRKSWLVRPEFAKKALRLKHKPSRL
ncbi:hypothetical protein BH09BAC6_BH09BAC6_19620 [soil metagenome]